jgi:hypothetical protein
MKTRFLPVFSTRGVKPFIRFLKNVKPPYFYAAVKDGFQKPNKRSDFRGLISSVKTPVSKYRINALTIVVFRTVVSFIAILSQQN